jgi:type VI secretion system secreted protein VgrG
MSANVTVTVASGDELDVRDFSVVEKLSELFSIRITALSDNPDIDFEAVAGQDASFTLYWRDEGDKPRTWTGICTELHQIRAEPTGASTYHLVISPILWLATQRRNHRMFQLETELQIVKDLLGEWGVAFEEKITGSYKTRKYRVQYGESDYDFMHRMMEDAGITFYFEEQGGKSKLVLADAPQANDLRQPPIAFRDAPTFADKEHVTAASIGRRVRPGKYTMRDVDYRRPATYPLMTTATGAAAVEQKLERFHYTPGAFLFESGSGGDTPNADDRATHRTDEKEGQKLADKRLAAKRGDAITATFITNVGDVSPGTVMSVLDHPNRALGDGKRLLVVESNIDGVRNGEYSNHVVVRSAAEPFHPELVTPKPKVQGVESATVVGPSGEEIHTDEFGRVRVSFHWDRESKMDQTSSCWIPVSQPWGGAGYGGTNLPRVGQEVLVDFLGGDPDRPMIVGRVYTHLQSTPYQLPGNKTQSGWKSNTSPSNGGYNEMMFEDKAGEELVRMQAQKDMHQLVKNDHSHTVGRNHTKMVGHDEREVTGNNRSVVVGSNRATQIGSIDSSMVGQTHSVMISPPGEAAPAAPATSFFMTDDKVAHNTKSGAYIEMVGDTIVIHASEITLNASTKITVHCDAEVDVEGTPINLNNS